MDGRREETNVVSVNVAVVAVLAMAPLAVGAVLIGQAWHSELFVVLCSLAAVAGRWNGCEALLEQDGESIDGSVGCNLATAAGQQTRHEALSGRLWRSYVQLDATAWVAEELMGSTEEEHGESIDGSVGCNLATAAGQRTRHVALSGRLEDFMDAVLMGSEEGVIGEVVITEDGGGDFAAEKLLEGEENRLPAAT